MSPLEAKNILLLRRSAADEADPEVARAMEVARGDSELQEWLNQQREFHEVVRKACLQIPVPPGLKHRILAHAPDVRLAWWRRFPVWSAVAAAVVLYIGFSALWPAGPGSDSFAIFRSRMVGGVLRQYQMDVRTNDLGAIRQFLSGHQAPANFVLTGGLNRLPPVGAGLLSWQGNRVSMVCLDSSVKGTVILFIVDAATLRAPPPRQPVFQRVNKLMTASWTSGDSAYLLMIDNPLIDERGLSDFL